MAARAWGAAAHLPVIGYLSSGSHRISGERGYRLIAFYTARIRRGAPVLSAFAANAPNPASDETLVWDGQMSTWSSVLNPAAVAPATRVRWKIFLLMLMLTSINYIDRASLSVAMPLIGKEFGLDPAMQGLILSSFFWTYAFMQVPGGMLADRYKPRIVIALSTVGWGFFQTIAAIATNWPMLLLTRLGLGDTEAPIYPAAASSMPCG